MRDLRATESCFRCKHGECVTPHAVHDAACDPGRRKPLGRRNWAGLMPVRRELPACGGPQRRQEAIFGPGSPVSLTRALRYYFGELPIRDADVAASLYGINITDMSARLHEPKLQALLNFVASGTGQLAVDLFAPLSMVDKERLAALPVTISAIEAQVRAMLITPTRAACRMCRLLPHATICQRAARLTFVCPVHVQMAQLQHGILRGQLQGLYHSAKVFLCCDVGAALGSLYVTCLSASGLALLLAVGLALRILPDLTYDGVLMDHSDFKV